MGHVWEGLHLKLIAEAAPNIHVQRKKKSVYLSAIFSQKKHQKVHNHFTRLSSLSGQSDQLTDQCKNRPAHQQHLLGSTTPRQAQDVVWRRRRPRYCCQASRRVRSPATAREEPGPTGSCWPRPAASARTRGPPGGAALPAGPGPGPRGSGRGGGRRPVEGLGAGGDGHPRPRAALGQQSKAAARQGRGALPEAGPPRGLHLASSPPLEAPIPLRDQARARAFKLSLCSPAHTPGSQQFTCTHLSRKTNLCQVATQPAPNLILSSA